MPEGAWGIHRAERVTCSRRQINHRKYIFQGRKFIAAAPTKSELDELFNCGADGFVTKVVGNICKKFIQEFGLKRQLRAARKARSNNYGDVHLR